MKGFTLLEVIIALIIAGMAATALFEAVGSGLRATQTASMYDQAIVRAKSRLAAATHGTKLAAGDWAGDDGGGFRWRLHVAPCRQCVAASVRSGRATRGHRRSRSSCIASVVRVGWNDGGTERDVRSGYRTGWRMKARTAAGFTLLEVLVALAVFGFLLVGLSQTVRFGLTAWRQNRGSVRWQDRPGSGRSQSSGALWKICRPGTIRDGHRWMGQPATLAGISALRVPAWDWTRSRSKPAWPCLAPGWCCGGDRFTTACARTVRRRRRKRS